MNNALPRDWRHRAACRDADPEIFFPVAESGPALARAQAEALDYCAVCPVRAECLAYALDSGEEFGVWGGMTAEQRRDLLRDRPRTPIPAPRRRPDPSPLAGRSGKGRRVRAVAIQQLIKGVPRAAVVREFGVHPRTVERWAARPEVRARLSQTQAVN
jgi:WhiB family redox-sensing transcriptional regulator